MSESRTSSNGRADVTASIACVTTLKAICLAQAQLQRCVVTDLVFWHSVPYVATLNSSCCNIVTNLESSYL
ncbi:hypothetical protein PVK06_042690 [Gossypium arboreum]|uniref:Uncharacterized protein n=1 Tax=Gossypium arboreum TaxID=29729 RepID=A0ABR0MNZ1_GOSAR|nr:hypothetical protein PVK06_042690 [Gossypium arboreum]